MSTRHRAREVDPWVGEAQVVMTAFGVSVRRASTERITGMAKEPPRMDNDVVYMVNEVVYRVN
jgi:hypothetical protein